MPSKPAMAAADKIRYTLADRGRLDDRAPLNLTCDMAEIIDANFAPYLKAVELLRRWCFVNGQVIRTPLMVECDTLLSKIDALK